VQLCDGLFIVAATTLKHTLSAEVDAAAAKLDKLLNASRDGFEAGAAAPLDKLYTVILADAAGTHLCNPLTSYYPHRQAKKTLIHRNYCLKRQRQRRTSSSTSAYNQRSLSCLAHPLARLHHLPIQLRSSRKRLSSFLSRRSAAKPGLVMCFRILAFLSPAGAQLMESRSYTHIDIVPRANIDTDHAFGSGSRPA